MKIAYLVFLDFGFLGVKKKIEQQIQALSNNKVEVIPIIVNWANKEDPLEIEGKYYHVRISKHLSLFKKRSFALHKAKEYIEEEKCDLLFFRYVIADPLFVVFLKQIRIPAVSEHQTKELNEVKPFSPKFFMEKFLGPLLRRNVSGIVSVTEEISNYQTKITKKGGSLHTFIGNGIGVEGIPIRSTPSNKEGPLKTLFVGSVADWHGLDRLISGLADSGKSNVYLHIVGDGPAIPQLKELVTQRALEDQVIFHGSKTGKGLDEMFDKCHIAVGSLGIHRLGLSESSVLKVREYCARGIPFIYSPIDQDFPESFPYQLKVPADDSPIDMEQITDFAKKVLADREHPKKMREYAFSNLDWNIKMRKLKGFFEEVLKKQVGK